ncbi:hypothetical protein F9C07_3860 [Aspergillus flavus]|uniref:Uncharacterized protein n=1 Tax=Aspergillus flavus (strain ATCC 200026 / FGSC A1120 / IAM 13836 / NRRL 3357 / JCM 12722 / SRRC 167) TaxID=332952 RepID=A0A7U2MUD5_ASPFN|nr:hypothetical protein F9C07_3860 [Aspergillus flavus]
MIDHSKWVFRQSEGTVLEEAFFWLEKERQNDKKSVVEVRINGDPLQFNIIPIMQWNRTDAERPVVGF